MDWPLIKSTFEKLCRHEDVIVPNYNYKTCKRDDPGLLIKCTDLILFEGIFALFDSSIRDLMDLKVFVHSDDDIRLLRRLKRDVLSRGRTVEGVIKSYNRFVKQSYEEYIKPTMKHSDIIVPRGRENQIAIDFIAENLKNRLKDRVREVVEEKKEEEEKVVESEIVISQDQLVQVIIEKMLKSNDDSLLGLHHQYLS
jgi:uridine kinase